MVSDDVQFALLMEEKEHKEGDGGFSRDSTNGEPRAKIRRFHEGAVPFSGADIYANIHAHRARVVTSSASASTAAAVVVRSAATSAAVAAVAAPGSTSAPSSVYMAHVAHASNPLSMYHGMDAPMSTSNADERMWTNKEINTREVNPSMRMDLDSVVRRVNRENEIDEYRKRLAQMDDDALSGALDRLSLGHAHVADGRSSSSSHRDSTGPSPASSYAAAAAYIARKMTEEHEKLTARKMIRPRMEIITNPNARRYCLGERRFKQMLRYPAWIMEQYSNAKHPNNPIAIDPVQAKFIEEFTFSCAELIYGDDWAANRIAFLREYGRNCIRKQTLCLSPRRFGKTWSLCIFVLSLMLCRPGIRIAVLSQNKRTSEAIVQTVRMFLSYIPNAEDRSASDSSDTVIIAPADTPAKMSQRKKRKLPDVSVLKALPCTSDGLRGTSADVFLLEESAFMPAVVFQTVVVPIMVLNTTVLLAISTPNEDDNYYSELLLLTDSKTGLPIFKTVMVGLICDVCRLNGRGSACPHRRYVMPAWHSHANQQLAKRMLSEHLYRQEMQGQIESSRRAAFEAGLITQMFASRTISFPTGVDILFLAIDPSGGSTSKSQLAAIAGVLNIERKLVVNTRHVHQHHCTREMLRIPEHGGAWNNSACAWLLQWPLLRVAPARFVVVSFGLARCSADTFSHLVCVHAKRKTGHEQCEPQRLAKPRDKRSVIREALQIYNHAKDEIHAIEWFDHLIACSGHDAVIVIHCFSEMHHDVRRYEFGDFLQYMVTAPFGFWTRANIKRIHENVVPGWCFDLRHMGNSTRRVWTERGSIGCSVSPSIGRFLAPGLLRGKRFERVLHRLRLLCCLILREMRSGIVVGGCTIGQDAEACMIRDSCCCCRCYCWL